MRCGVAIFNRSPIAPLVESASGPFVSRTPLTMGGAEGRASDRQEEPRKLS